MNFLAKRFFASLIAFATLAFTAFSQGSTGDLKGTVTDAAGAVVTGASVEVKNQETNETRILTTGDNGEYFASRLPVGTYTITISAKGFSSTVIKNIRVSVASVADQNLTMSVAGSEAQ